MDRSVMKTLLPKGQTRGRSEQCAMMNVFFR